MNEKQSALAPTRARQKVSNKSKNTKWTAEEDEYFTKIMVENPNLNWTEVAGSFPGKTAQQVAERWEKVLNPTLIKGSWTREEDETIIKFVQENGTKNWTKLSSLLPGRIGKQCRERWRNHLDPEVNRDPWTNEEDAILIEMHESLGNQWVKIAEHIPGRSDNCVKNRWNSTLKKRLLYSQGNYQKPRRGRPSLLKTHKSADDVPIPPRIEEISADIKSQSPTKNPTPNLLSPFTLKSPFGIMSPLMKDNGFGFWSPPREQKDYEGASCMSPNLFSPSLAENRAGIANLLSPLYSKNQTEHNFPQIPSAFN